MNLFNGTKDMKPKALIICESGSSSNCLGTAKSLHQKGIKVIKLTPRNWYNSKTCESVICKSIPNEPANLLEFLIKIGKKFTHKNVLFPSSDNSLIFISKNKEELENYFELVASPWEITAKIVDKSKTFDEAKKLGIPFPRTFVPEDMNEVNKISHKIEYPCLIKPAHSHVFIKKYGKKLLRVNSAKALVEQCNFLKSKENKIVIQEEIPGSDDKVYSFNAVFNQDSKPLAVFLGQKLRQYPPNFGVGTLTKSVWNQKLAEVGVRLLKGMKFSGIAAVEFKKDERSGEFKLLEINGRSWSWNYLATFCGMNMPHIAYCDLVDKKQEELTELSCNYKLGLKWLHIGNDVRSFILKRQNDEITLSDWTRSILNRHKTYAFLSVRDPYPFLCDITPKIRSFKSFLQKKSYVQPKKSKKRRQN